MYVLSHNCKGSKGRKFQMESGILVFTNTVSQSTLHVHSSRVSNPWKVAETDKFLMTVSETSEVLGTKSTKSVDRYL